MIYYINESIVFDSEKRVLSNIHRAIEREPIFLTHTCARCLKVILDFSYMDLTVSRQELLRLVWWELNLPANNNNLNQCICIIRKAFKSIGYKEDIIVTVSKQGYRVDQKTSIKKGAVSAISRKSKKPYLHLVVTVSIIIFTTVTLALFYQLV